MYALTPFNQVLGRRKAKHLLRRATFNFSKSTIESIAGMTATEAVTFLSTNPSNIIAEPQDPGSDGFWTSSTQPPSSFKAQARKRAYVTGWWWYNAVNQITLKHKLSFFLFTSFTVSKDNGAGAATLFYDYLRLLDTFAMGNIKTFAKKITSDNAMLNYLDNTKNNANNPNENYAREFLELFTILKGPQIGNDNYTNYTELDVQQAAKVFSGFKKQEDRTLIDPDTNLPKGYNNVNKHDKNNKTFSSAFGNHIITGQSTEEGMNEELDDFVEMVFAQEETAKAYCRKLYRFFVRSTWDASVESDIITPLAQELISNNFEILPVVTTLLSSQHFYDEDNTNNSDEIIGGMVKHPLQMLNEVITLFQIPIPDPDTEADDYYVQFFRRFAHDSFLDSAGMDFFSPNTVAGYPAYYQEPSFDRLWFSSNTIITRYKLIESFIRGRNSIFPNASIKTEIDIVAFVENNITTPKFIRDLVSELASLLYPEDISTERITYFIEIALDGFADFYWTGIWNDYISTGDDTIVRNRLNTLVTTMVNAAEFQLM